MILLNCGFLYGGSSKTKEDGTSFSNVLDKNLETIKVSIIPNKTIQVTVMVEINDTLKLVKKFVIKIVEIVIKNGNLPLHGTKLLVKVAISLSLGDSIILVPTIPALLHPNPIHIVKACFPRSISFLKNAI